MMDGKAIAVPAERCVTHSATPRARIPPVAGEGAHGNAYRGRTDRRALDDACHEDDNQDHQQHRQQAARCIAPASAMRPGWHGADDQQNKDDEKNCAHDFVFRFMLR